VQDDAAVAEAPSYQIAALQRQVQQLGGDVNTGYVERRDKQLGLVDVMSSEAAHDPQAASEWVTLQKMVEEFRGRSSEKANKLQQAKWSEQEAWTLARQSQNELRKLEAERKKVTEALLEVKRVASAELREASIQLQREHEDVGSLVKWANTMQQDADAKVKWAKLAQTQAAKQVNWATAAQKEAARAADAMEQVAQAQLKTQGLS